jgi:tetratricopeptide (TPR) repeat protein
MVTARLLAGFMAALGVGVPQSATVQQALVPGNPAVPPPASVAPPPPAPLTLEHRGDILMARKMYREAIETYRQVQPPTAVVINKIGIAHHQLLLLSQARRYYQQAVKMDRNYSEAINNIGTVYYAEKSYRRAVAHYKRALKLAPNSASIYSNLGTAEFARKRYKQAMEAYQKALELDPEVFEHRSGYGTVLQERSVEEKAKFHYYMAKTYAQAGFKDRALQYLRRALEEGFKDRQKLLEDNEFAAIRESPEFQELLAYQPRVL